MKKTDRVPALTKLVFYNKKTLHKKTNQLIPHDGECDWERAQGGGKQKQGAGGRAGAGQAGAGRRGSRWGSTSLRKWYANWNWRATSQLYEDLEGWHYRNRKCQVQWLKKPGPCEEEKEGRWNWSAKNEEDRSAKWEFWKSKTRLHWVSWPWRWHWIFFSMESFKRIYFLKKDCLHTVWRLESKEWKTDFSQDTQTVGPGEMTDCDSGNGGRQKWPDWE